MSGIKGSYLNHYSYLPFGENFTKVEAVANPFGYVGQWGVMSEGTDALLMHHREYSTATGRFSSQDPLGITGGPNLYTYSLNSPAVFVDPSGLDFRSLSRFVTGQWERLSDAVTLADTANTARNEGIGTAVGEYAAGEVGKQLFSSWGADIGFGLGELIFPEGGGIPGAYWGHAIGGGIGESIGTRAYRHFFPPGGDGYPPNSCPVPQNQCPVPQNQCPVPQPNNPQNQCPVPPGNLPGPGGGSNNSGPSTTTGGPCTDVIGGTYFYICLNNHAYGIFVAPIHIPGRDCSGQAVVSALASIEGGPGGVGLGVGVGVVPPEIVSTEDCNPVHNTILIITQNAIIIINDPPIDTTPPVTVTDQAANDAGPNGNTSPLAFIATVLGNLGLINGQSGNDGYTAAQSAQMVSTISTFDQVEADLADILETASTAGGSIGIAGDIALVQQVDSRLEAVTTAENLLFGGDANWLDTKQSATLQQWMTDFFTDAQNSSDGTVSAADMTQHHLSSNHKVDKK